MADEVCQERDGGREHRSQQGGKLAESLSPRVSEASHPGATCVPLSIGSGYKAHRLWGLKLSGLQDRREGGQVAWTQPLLITHMLYNSPSWSAQVNGF